jgi:hypothetical protein
MPRLSLALLLLVACPDPVQPPSVVAPIDADGDGYYGLPAGNDCDDRDNTVHPYAADETCDGVDNDCYHQDGPDDADEDGATVCAGDCDDADPLRSPLTAERCNQRDDDCDEAVDEDFDQDHDGHFACGGLLTSEPRQSTSNAEQPIGPPLVPVDLDGDGKTEVVASYSPPFRLHTAAILWPGADCDLCVANLVGTPENALLLLAPAGDANGDGAPDVLLHERTPSGGAYEPQLLLGGAAPSLAVGAWSTPAENPWTMYAPIGDLNADGRTEQALVFGYFSGPPYEVWLGEFTDASFAVTASGWVTDDDLTLPTTSRLTSADLNADGWPELILGGVSTDTRPWLVMLPGTMLGPTAVGATIVPVFGGISEAPMELITGGDLDGDGFGDLVASTVFEDGQTFAYALRVLYGGPDGVREGPNLPSAPGPHRVRILPDVDGDGRDELVVLTDVPREAETGPETDTRDETGGPPFVPTVVTWELEVWSVAPTPVRRQAVPAGTALAGEAVGIVVADLTGDRSPEVILAAPGSLEGPVLKVFATVSDCDDHDPAVWRGCP